MCGRGEVKWLGEKIFLAGKMRQKWWRTDKEWKAPMRLSSIPRVNSNHRKRRFAANGSRMDTGVKRKWRLVRGRVAFERGGESRRENEDEEFLLSSFSKSREGTTCPFCFARRIFFVL